MTARDDWPDAITYDGAAVESMYDEIDRLRAENARLAADLAALRAGSWGHDLLMPPPVG